MPGEIPGRKQQKENGGGGGGGQNRRNRRSNPQGNNAAKGAGKKKKGPSARVSILEKVCAEENGRIAALEKRLAVYMPSQSNSSPSVAKAPAAIPATLPSLAVLPTAAAAMPVKKAGEKAAAMPFMSPDSKNFSKLKEDIGWESPALLSDANEMTQKAASALSESAGDEASSPPVPAKALCFASQFPCLEASSRAVQLFPPAKALPFASQSPCLASIEPWRALVSCLTRLGFMLLYGATGQCEGADGEFLQDREKDLFDCLLEFILRLLPAFAPAIASNGDDGDGGGVGTSTRRSALSRVVSSLSSQLDILWEGVSRAMDVIEGNCYLMPERFGSLVRAQFVWTALEQCFQSQKEAQSLRDLVRACCRPLPKRTLAGRRSSKNKVQQLFVSVLRTATVGTTGLGRSTRNITGQILTSPLANSYTNNRGGAADNNESFVGAEEMAGDAYVPVLFKGSGKAWPGFPISPAIRSAVADTRMKNALNQLARTEPEMLRSDLIFLLRAPCVSVLEPANKLSFLHSASRRTWRTRGALHTVTHVACLSGRFCTCFSAEPHTTKEASSPLP